MEISTLTLISTDELLAELISRYDNSVFVGEKNHRKDSDSFIQKSRYEGDRVICLGLCEWIKHDIVDALTKDADDIDVQDT